ncbi:MAG: hypothetical protein ACFFKA_00250 [Candidatus Thorarchaeota archaeon]
MYIRLGDNIVNLDLVRAISPVIQIAMLKRKDGSLDDHGWLMTGNPDTRGPEETEKLSFFSHWEWMFQVEYVNGDRVDVFGTVEVQMEAARLELADLLNNNQSIIPVIQVETHNVDRWNYSGSQISDDIYYHRRKS